MSYDRLALAQVAPLFAYAAGTAGGQLLFKAAALRYAADAPPGERILSLGFRRGDHHAFVVRDRAHSRWVASGRKLKPEPTARVRDLL
jgi:hypothetical protein